MKYDKYIVEVDTKGVFWGGEVVYPIKGLGSYLTAEQLLKLTPLADQCHDCCNSNKTEENKKAYEQGLHIAWDAAKRIVLAEAEGGLNYDVRKKVFGKGNYQIMKDNTIEEVLKELKELDEQRVRNRILVGDEVIDSDGLKSVVVDVISDRQLYIWNENCMIKKVSPQEVTKTGKSYLELIEILKGLQEKKE